MRRALAPAAALLVAACQVDVEGARCRVPGATSDCPAGQACGNDGRCSERALACEKAGTRCELGTALCAGNDDTERVERCSGAADPACGTWVVEDCHAAGLACGTASGVAGCECPAYGGAEFAADPVAGSRDAALLPLPTGAPSPPVCRFGRLGDALAAAAAALGDHPDGTSARAYGAAGPVVFGDVASGETLPLALAAGVTLRGAEAPAGPTIVRAELATGAGFTVGCGRPGSARIEDLTLEGGGSLTKGVDVVADDCAVELARVHVSDVNGPALASFAKAAGTVAVTASAFRTSAVGVQATGGRLSLGSQVPGDAVEVSGNAGEGILLSGWTDGTLRALDVAISGVIVKENGGTGVVLDPVSTTSKLSIDGSEITENGEVAPRNYGFERSMRAAGGVALLANDGLAAFSFLGNRVYANGGDDAGVDEIGIWSDATWPLGPSSCGPSSNALGCAGPQGAALAVRVIGNATVNAAYNVWSSSNPTTLVSGATFSPACEPKVNGAPPAPVCPTP